MDDSDILAVDRFGMNSKCLSARRYFARRGFPEIRVLVVLIILTDIDHRELPERRHVHDFVQQPLTERAIAKETNRHLISAVHLRRHRRAGSHSSAAADDGVVAEIAGVL